MTISSRELVERMRVQLPLAMELPDPITGAPFIVNRDNVLALLAIDVDNLVLESQTVAMMFGEMARLHAAAKLAKEQADVSFRQWKAATAARGRATLDGGMTAGKNPVKKPPTKEQVETYYRTDADYDHEYQKANRASVIVDLIADLKAAFQLKQRALHDLHGVTFGHNEVASTDDRMRELEASLEAAAIVGMEQSSYELEEIRTGKPATPAAPAEEPASKSSKRPKKPAKGK